MVIENVTGVWWSHAIGYIFSIMGGVFFIAPLMHNLKRTLRFAECDQVDLFSLRYGTRLLGTIESILFTGSVQIGHPEFIGIWLVLKVAAGLEGWKHDQRNENGELVTGRTKFNVYLIGSGLSIAYGVIGAFIIALIQSCRYWTAFFVPLALILLTCVFIAWAKARAKSDDWFIRRNIVQNRRQYSRQKGFNDKARRLLIVKDRLVSLKKAGGRDL